MNNSGRFLRNVTICYNHLNRSAATTTTEVVAPRFKKLKETQKRFQVDNGIPVYLKGGFSDKALFGLTVLLTAVGLSWSLETFYSLSFGKKN